MFSKYGRLIEISLKQNYGFLEFDHPTDAAYAVRHLHGCLLDGKPLTVAFASPKRNDNRQQLVESYIHTQDHFSSSSRLPERRDDYRRDDRRDDYRSDRALDRRPVVDRGYDRVDRDRLDRDRLDRDRLDRDRLDRDRLDRDRLERPVERPPIDRYDRVDRMDRVDRDERRPFPASVDRYIERDRPLPRARSPPPRVLIDRERSPERRVLRSPERLRSRSPIDFERSNKRRRSSKFSPPRNSQYRLLIKNLPKGCCWQDLKDHFRKVGNVCFADVRGHDGIVEYVREADMKIAIQDLDQTIIRGGVITVVEDDSSRKRQKRSPHGDDGTDSKADDRSDRERRDRDWSEEPDNRYEVVTELTDSTIKVGDRKSHDESFEDGAIDD